MVGVGYGKKVKGNRKTNEDSIVIMVDKKIPEKTLLKKDIIPQKLGHIKTDVQEVGILKLLKTSRSKKYRPAPGGVSIGHYKVTAGTLGTIVKDNRSGEPLILSNNHVLANITNGHDGRSQIGDPILQPGSYDDGRKKDDVIGNLVRYVPLKSNNNMFSAPTNLVDCALARPINKEIIDYSILGIGKINGVTDPELDMKVIKSGRTTGVTEAKIRAIDSTVRVNLDDTRKAMFTDQIITSPFSEGGDSGSLVLDTNNNTVGLLFAGSSKASVCNKITNVMKELDIDFFLNEKESKYEATKQKYGSGVHSIFLILVLLVLSSPNNRIF